MSKKEGKKEGKIDFVSGLGVAFEIISRLVISLKALGGKGEELRLVLSVPGLSDKIAELIMDCGQKVRETYKVIVDYSMTLAEMIKAGNYDWVNDAIVKRFKIQGSGKHAFDLVLVTVPEILEWLIAQGQASEEQIAEKWVTTRQVIAYLSSHGLLAALIEHLLAFGAAYPELKRQFQIIALGSSFVHGHGPRDCSCLDGPVDERGLSLFCFVDDSRWNDRCCFLAVGK